jgi:(p)ppGpp synthase/HD superfamily hydrolase
MPTLDDAIALAVKAHRGHKDKAGKPYILHPLHVMMRMDTPDAMMAAVLHDVVEDSDTTLADLRDAGYPPHVVDAVDGMSRREGETYEAYIERLIENPLARQIKIADLEHNMDVRRFVNPTPDDFERLRSYRRAWSVVTGRD